MSPSGKVDLTPGAVGSNRLPVQRRTHVTTSHALVRHVAPYGMFGLFPEGTGTLRSRGAFCRPLRRVPRPASVRARLAMGYMIFGPGRTVSVFAQSGTARKSSGSQRTPWR